MAPAEDRSLDALVRPVLGGDLGTLAWLIAPPGDFAGRNQAPSVENARAAARAQAAASEAEFQGELQALQAWEHGVVITSDHRTLGRCTVQLPLGDALGASAGAAGFGGIDRDATDGGAPDVFDRAGDGQGSEYDVLPPLTIPDLLPKLVQTEAEFRQFLAANLAYWASFDRSLGLGVRSDWRADAGSAAPDEPASAETPDDGSRRTGAATDGTANVALAAVDAAMARLRRAFDADPNQQPGAVKPSELLRRVNTSDPAQASALLQLDTALQEGRIDAKLAQKYLADAMTAGTLDVDGLNSYVANNKDSHDQLWWWLHDHGLASTKHEQAELLRWAYGPNGGLVITDKDGDPIDVDRLSDDEVLALNKEFRDQMVAPHAPLSAVLATVVPLALDGTGQVHGVLPTVKQVKKWSREDLEHSADALERSIAERKRKQLFMGEDGPHRARIGEEEDLLRAIRKILSGS